MTMSAATYNGAKALLERDYADNPAALTKAIGYLDSRRDSASYEDSLSPMSTAILASVLSGADDTPATPAAATVRPANSAAYTSLFQQALLAGKTPTEARAIAKVTEALSTDQTPALTREEYVSLPKATQAELGAGVVTEDSPEDAEKATRARQWSGQLTDEETAELLAKHDLSIGDLSTEGVSSDRVKAAQDRRTKDAMLAQARDRQVAGLTAIGYSEADARRQADKLPESSLLGEGAGANGQLPGVKAIDIAGSPSGNAAYRREHR